MVGQKLSLMRETCIRADRSPSCRPPFDCVQCFHVLTVKMNFLSEDNKVSVHFTEVQGCTAFVNNIRVDVLSQHAYCSTGD